MAKTLIFSLIGFMFPVAIATLLAPRIFPGAFPTGTTSALFQTEKGQPQDSLTKAAQASAAGLDGGSDSDDDRIGGDERTGVVSLASDAALDPQSDKAFVISFQVNFHEFPTAGKRQKIIAKYEPDRKPHAGWAIGVRRLKTSFRPEVYWQTADGKGGWYSFDAFNLVLNRWYTFTVVAVPGQFVNAFVERAEVGPVGNQSESEMGSAEDSLIGNTPRLQFAGGYSIAEISRPESSAPLILSPVSERTGRFRGQVGEVVLALSKDVPRSRRRLEALFRGGVKSIASNLDFEDISLWIDESGRDKSRFKRTLLSGATATDPAQQVLPQGAADNVLRDSVHSDAGKQAVAGGVTAEEKSTRS